MISRFLTHFTHLHKMILLNRNNISDSIIVTIFEKRLNPASIYLFVFKNVTTRAKLTFFKSDADDQTIAPSRYNEFVINSSVVFAGQVEGQYQYNVYEAVNQSTTVTTGMNLLETGKMLLQNNAARIIKSYAPTTTYKGYGG